MPSFASNANHTDFVKYNNIIIDNMVTKITDGNKKLTTQVVESMLVVANHAMVGRRFIVDRLT